MDGDDGLMDPVCPKSESLSFLLNSHCLLISIHFMAYAIWDLTDQKQNKPLLHEWAQNPSPAHKHNPYSLEMILGQLLFWVDTTVSGLAGKTDGPGYGGWIHCSEFACNGHAV